VGLGVVGIGCSPLSATVPADEQRQKTVLNINNIKNQAEFRAGPYKIPHLQQSLYVVGNQFLQVVSCSGRQDAKALIIGHLLSVDTG
jgi:hypothetical protein